MELRPYQLEGAKFLAGRRRALLADEMGLGKSAQAIVACDLVEARRVLVVCPASLCDNWKREFHRFSSRSVAAHRVTSQTAREIVNTLIRSISLDDHVGTNEPEKREYVVGTVQSPTPLRLNAFDGAAAKSAVVSSIQPAPEVCEKINYGRIGACKGHGPRGLFVLGVDHDPALAVDDARHVRHDGDVCRGPEGLRSLSCKTKRSPESLGVSPTERSLSNGQRSDNLFERGASGKLGYSGVELGIGQLFHVAITSYDTALRVSDLLGLSDFDVVIADEIHYCKSRTAKRTKAILGEKCDGVGGLIERAKHVFALTGTPTPNHSGEIWPLLRALAPEVVTSKVTRRPMTYWQFVDRYCKTVDNGFGIQIIGNRNTVELKTRISDFVLRRRKDDVANDIPPIAIDTLPLSHKAAAKALKAAEDEEAETLRKALKDGAEGLKKIATHVASLRRATGMAKAPAVVEWIENWLEAGGEKLVVFAHHTDVLKTIFDAFREESCMITGETPAAKRQAQVDLFQHNAEKKLFIGQIQAAGTGITLTAASEVLFAESSWVPAENQQAAMRVHRIGQNNACLVRFATLTGSLDEQIQQTVARKTAEIAQLFG